MKQLGLISLLVLLTACGQEFKLRNDLGPLSSTELVNLSRKMVGDVETTAATGDEAAVTVTEGLPTEVCGIQKAGTAPELNAQEREVVELLSREEALQRMIQMATEMKERLKDAKTPDINELEAELQKLREAIARLESDPSYQAAFDRGRLILKDRIDGVPSGAKPNLTEEQRDCLLATARRLICKDAVHVLANGALPDGRVLPEIVQGSFGRFFERHCEDSN